MLHAVPCAFQHAGENTRCVRVIFHHENCRGALGARDAVQSSGRTSDARVLQRVQRYRKRRALAAACAPYFYFPIMRIDDAFRNREPETEAAVKRTNGGFALLERFENT